MILTLPRWGHHCPQRTNYFLLGHTFSVYLLLYFLKNCLYLTLKWTVLNSSLKLPLAAPLDPVFLSSFLAAVVFLSATAVRLPAPPVQPGGQALILRWQHLEKVHHYLLGSFSYISFQWVAGASLYTLYRVVYCLAFSISLYIYNVNVSETLIQ